MNSAPAAVPDSLAARRGRLWWLPGGGQGNGLDDDAWAPVLEVSEQIVPTLLKVLRDAGVPGYAAPARPAAARLRARSKFPGAYRIWVGASAYGEAESALLAVMPQRTREATRRADSAWR
jgi:hypothetical protein